MKASMKNMLYIAIGVVVVYGLYRYVFMSKRDGFESGSTFTLYYAEWCPHCKTVKPAFESWMSSQKLVNAQMLEADRDSSKVQAAGVKGFPTFQLTKEDGSVVECNARDAAGWDSFLKANM
jgi:thiol-disulfide isomerase/thioredoxin